MLVGRDACHLGLRTAEGDARGTRPDKRPNVESVSPLLACRCCTQAGTSISHSEEENPTGSQAAEEFSDQAGIGPFVRVFYTVQLQ